MVPGDDRSALKIRRYLAVEFPTDLSATNFVWRYLPEEQINLGLGRPIEEFEQVHEAIRKKVRQLPAGAPGNPNALGDKDKLADALKIDAGVAAVKDRSTTIESWLQHLDRRIAEAGPPPEPVAGPEIVFFESNLSSIPRGETIVLKWETRNATTVVIEQLTTQAEVLMSRTVSTKGTLKSEQIHQVCTFELKATRGTQVAAKRFTIQLIPEAPTHPPLPPPRPPFKPDVPVPGPSPRSFDQNDSPEPLLRQFTVSPKKVKAGEGFTVSWDVARARSVRLEFKEANGKTLSEFDVPLYGTQRFDNVQQSTVVVLTVVDLQGNVLHQSLTVSLSKVRKYLLFGVAAALVLLLLLSWPPPPPTPPVPARILSLTAEKLSIHTGDGATVHWSTENATKIELNGTKVEAAGVKSFSGLRNDLDVTLSAQNSAGQTVNQTIKITVTEPPSVSGPWIDSFDVPGNVVSGGSAHVSWSAEGVEAFLDGNPVPLSGSKELTSLSRQTTLKLKVVGADHQSAEQTRTIQITENSPPPLPPPPHIDESRPKDPEPPPPASHLPQLHADNLSGSVSPCSPVMVRWSSADASSVAVGSTPVALMGQTIISVGQTTDLEFTASNSSGSVNKTVSIPITPSTATSGKLEWKGDVPQNGEVRLTGNLPGRKIILTYDEKKWLASTEPNPSNSFCKVYLRSIKPGMQHKAEATWQLAP
jgi:hypothetical protein